jgi:integrase
MAVYRPTKDTKVWWYDFIFEGQRVRESAKTRSKTLAKDAERARRRELEQSYNGIKRRARAKLFSLAADEWLVLKSLTLAASSQRIERYNLKHLRPNFEKRLVTDIEARDVSRYQQTRLAEGASPKTINLEVGTLRAILRRHRVWAEIQQDVRMLSAADDIGHAITPEEEAALLTVCLKSRCRCLYLAVMFALNTGMRYSEIRLLRWRQVDIAGRILTVGKSKSPTGAGRVIPLNSRILSVLEMWTAQFPGRQPAHFVFPSEKYGAAGKRDRFGFTADVVVYNTDPTRPIGEWKEAWEKAKDRAGAILSGAAENEESEPLKCRFHDLRHTAVTRLLEAGISYPVVASLMGWSAATTIRMAKRYGHIGNKALRDATDVLGGVKISLESLKNTPKSAESEKVAVQ